MKALLPLIFLSSALFSEIDYHNLIEKYPAAFGRNGSWKSGEIEVASSDREIERIHKICKERYIRMGYSPKEAEEHTKIGVIAEDHYWIWVRDAVTFPGGIPGVYNRLFWKSGLSGPHGSAILPVLPNKKILVIVHFRHATRSWELELPRGARKEGESDKQAAARELQEETGCLCTEFTPLGEMCPDSGALSNSIPIFLGKIKSRNARHLDEGEAIAHCLEMTIDEIKSAYTQGYLITDVHGVKTKVYCRDPFLSYALLQAMWKNLI